MKSVEGVAAIGRDPDALEAFYREHIEAVQRFVARRVDTPEDAADLTAEVFLAAIHASRSYRGDAAAPRAWLYGIARRVVASHHRSTARALRAVHRIGTRDLLDDDATDRIVARIDSHGKGSKIRYVPVMDPTARLVADYLERRDPHPGIGADADPLFCGPNHSRLTRSGIAKLLARHVRAVRARDPGWAPGLPITPHTLRRSRAMHLIQAGVNLIYIRDLLGHADVSTTEIYARADAETKRKALENAYQALTPDVLPDWTSDASLIGWLDSLGR